MFKNIRLLFIMAFILLGTFAFAEETTVTDVTTTDVQSLEVETEGGVAETATQDTATEEKTAATKKEEKAAEKAEKEQKKQEKLDRYQARLFKRLEMTIDSYNAAAAIPVIDMYRHRMLGGGTACIVTGSLMAVCCPVMMALGGVFGFTDEYGGQCFVDVSTKEGADSFNNYLPYFIAGTVIFSMGSLFGVLSLIITPMCSIYFSKAHQSRLVLKRLKGLAMLQGLDVNYINDGDHDKLGLSYGIRI